MYGDVLPITSRTRLFAASLVFSGALAGCAQGGSLGSACDSETPCLDPAAVCVEARCVVDTGADAGADAGTDAAVDAEVPTPPDDAAPLDAALPPGDDAAPPDATPPDAVPPPDAGAVCGDGTCQPLAGESCTSCSADCPSLPAPTGLSPDGATITGASVTMDWDPACGATAYEVTAYFLNSGTWSPYYTWSTPNDFFTFWPVTITDYYFVVRATDGTGFGPVSAEAYFTYSG